MGDKKKLSVSGACAGNQRRVFLVMVMVVLLLTTVTWRSSSDPKRMLPSVTKATTTALEKEKQHCNFLEGHGKPGRCPGCLSQGYQDKILEDIFNIIGTTNKEAVEFGFGYTSGRTMKMEELLNSGRTVGAGLNIHTLVRKGWHPTFFDAILENPLINLHKAVLTQDNIADEFRKASISADADFVSIDVDSVDVWLFYGMLKGGYRPRVISSEYNSNFFMDQAIACEPKWQPWRQGGTVYGSSAAALHFVAEQFGYQPVAIVPLLDIFFVRQDILRDTCSNFEYLPTFESLAQHWTGKPAHRYCDRNTDAMRLVDVPLFMEGKEQEAREKAQHVVDELNQRRKAMGLGAFCDESTK